MVVKQKKNKRVYVWVGVIRCLVVWQSSSLKVNVVVGCSCLTFLSPPPLYHDLSVTRSLSPSLVGNCVFVTGRWVNILVVRWVRTLLVLLLCGYVAMFSHGFFVLHLSLC